MTDFVPGDYVALSVRDTGIGMSEVRERDPFFSTKLLGKGTGLGLAICQAIMTAHDGKIWAENKPEGGCRFTIELPAHLTMSEAQ